MVFKFQTELQIHKHLNKLYPNLELTRGPTLSSTSIPSCAAQGTVWRGGVSRSSQRGCRLFLFPGQRRHQIVHGTALAHYLASPARVHRRGRRGLEPSSPPPPRPRQPPLLARERCHRALASHLRATRAAPALPVTRVARPSSA